MLFSGTICKKGAENHAEQYPHGVRLPVGAAML
jgi:hypothetical protein